MSRNHIIVFGMIALIAIALTLGLAASLAVLAARARAQKASVLALPEAYHLMDPARFAIVMIEIPRSTTSEEDERTIQGIVDQVHASGKDAYIIVCGTPTQAFYGEQLQCVAFLYFRNGERE